MSSSPSRACRFAGILLTGISFPPSIRQMSYSHCSRTSIKRNFSPSLRRRCNSDTVISSSLIDRGFSSAALEFRRTLFRKRLNSFQAVVRRKASHLVLDFRFQGTVEGVLLATEERLLHGAHGDPRASSESGCEG